MMSQRTQSSVQCPEGSKIGRQKSSIVGNCQNHLPWALRRGQTSAQPSRLSPQSPGLTLEQTILGGILVDFQAGELVSPACKLYIHFKKSHDMICSGS